MSALFIDYVCTDRGFAVLFSLIAHLPDLRGSCFLLVGCNCLKLFFFCRSFGSSRVEVFTLAFDFKNNEHVSARPKFNMEHKFETYFEHDRTGSITVETAQKR